MSLDSNTTELNEILEMAKNLPEAGEGEGEGEGGEAVQEVYYANATINPDDFSVVMLSSVDELFAVAAETPLKHIALTVSFGEMRMIVPMSAFSLEGGVIAFDNAGKVGGADMPVSVEVYADGTINSSLGGGDAPQTGEQEIAYADCVFDFSTLSVSSDVTFEQLKAFHDEGKYIVGRSVDATGFSYLPLTGFSTEKNIFVFTGLSQANLGSGLVVLSITVEVTSSNEWIVRARVVTVTDLN